MLAFECAIAEYRKPCRSTNERSAARHARPPAPLRTDDDVGSADRTSTTRCASRDAHRSHDRRLRRERLHLRRTRRCASATSPAPSASCPIPPTDNHRTLFVAVRGDPSITRIDVHLPGSFTGNPGFDEIVHAAVAQRSGRHAVRGHRRSTLRNAPRVRPEHAKTSSPAPCDASFLVQDYRCTSQPNCTVGINNNGKTQLPTEPFGMAHRQLQSERAAAHGLAPGDGAGLGHRPRPHAGQRAALRVERRSSRPTPRGRHGAFALAAAASDRSATRCGT